ncbi:MAG: OmpA family protein [Bacteroidales bacterium]|nr:OmpA family protein [Bacteroidales bacterium]
MVRIAVLMLIILIPFTAYPQKRKAQKAFDAWEAGEYFEAIDLFKDAYSKTRDRDEKSEYVFMVAECYRLTNNPRSAEPWYKRISGRDNARPEATYWYAQTLKKNGKYEEALKAFEEYKQIVPSDAQADLGIRSCELAIEWMESPQPYEVEEIRDLNSRYSDFCPVYARDDYGMVYITSSREEAEGKRDHGATGENFSDIFESRLDKKDRWSTPVPVKDLNTEFEDGAVSFSSDFRQIYYTLCEVGNRENRGCVIMTAVRNEDGWSQPERLDVLPDSLVAAHPAISPDGLTLYFVSQLPDGYGGKDIYFATRASAGDQWSRPENIGPGINTRGDEMFPYVRSDGSLYFSSNGHIGMGGLDIFKAELQADGRWLVDNMRYPINSNADDFGISFQSENETGLFSSTRKGRSNDEIYSFVLPPLRFSVTGLVKDEETGEPIPDALVQLIASDGTTVRDNSGESGEFRFMLNEDVDYIFLASKEGYLNGKEKETTRGQDQSREFLTTILMTSIDKPIELPNILYDFNKWDLRPESMVSLDKLVETLNDNPNVTIELMSHTDSRDTEEYNMELSQKRAQAVVDYLIDKGIDPERLSARGYGESSPKVVDEEIASAYDFLREGYILNEQFINSLPDDEQKEIAHQINRRTEFRVLSTEYEEK